MCLAIPGKVLEIDGKIGKVDFGGTIRDVNVSMVEVSVGEYVIVHAGYAINKMSEREAKETLKMFEEVLEAAEESEGRGI